MIVTEHFNIDILLFLRENGTLENILFLHCMTQQIISER